MQVAEVQYDSNLSRFVTMRIILTIEQWIDDQCNSRSTTFVAIDFLLVIICHLSSISHHFLGIASRSRKPPHLSLSPRARDPFKFRYKLRPHATFVWNRVILTSIVLLQYTRGQINRQINDKQTTYGPRNARFIVENKLAPFLWTRCTCDLC